MQPGTAYTAFSDSIAYCYNGFLGLPATREAVAYFLTRRFLEPTKTRGTSLMHVSPDCIALGSGCASLLNHLFFSLAEKGDAVLIPAPYHSAFEYDMQVRVLLLEKDCANAESTCLLKITHFSFFFPLARQSLVVFLFQFKCKIQCTVLLRRS
jgi:hypothetical protein